MKDEHKHLFYGDDFDFIQKIAKLLMFKGEKELAAFLLLFDAAEGRLFKGNKILTDLLVYEYGDIIEDLIFYQTIQPSKGLSHNINTLKLKIFKN